MTPNYYGLLIHLYTLTLLSWLRQFGHGNNRNKLYFNPSFSRLSIKSTQHSKHFRTYIRQASSRTYVIIFSTSQWSTCT